MLGLSEAMQFVVFGAAILAGMIVSGDRIAAGLGTGPPAPEDQSAPRRETVDEHSTKGGISTPVTEEGASDGAHDDRIVPGEEEIEMHTEEGEVRE